ncbi:hypothetical protein LPUS_02387 [Lasallia pustulata]|uniref:Uncharacterized protein n=1 Tax=Lasallia pustulata TaxID=136370 RepID=A0A1W5CSH7_9LECA|nr:hypothetical protein LPUS_02387 [Lasallia pustulata]
MGRKPNPLILEFFERGPKLDDASNRYQHTCKACGEVFPKGRTDSLNNHLTKKCQAIPLRDRQRAALQIHELPDILDSFHNTNHRANEGLKNGGAVDLPFAGSRRLTGLDALAEASRRFAKDVTPGNSRTGAVDDSAIDPSLRDFISSQSSRDIQSATSSNALTTTSAAFDNIPFPPMQFSDSPTSSPRMAVLTFPSTSAIKDPSALSLIAASASDLEPMPGYAALPLEPGLYSTVAFHKINYAKSQARFEDYVSRIEATHDVESDISISLSALRGQRKQHHHSIDANGAEFELDIIILNDVGDDVPGKLDQYLKKMTSTMYAQEPSPLMRATLEMAAELSAAKNDVLLARVQDLWKATSVLVDNDPRWKLSMNFVVPGLSSPTGVPLSDENLQIDVATNKSETYDLICSQLRAAAEKRGAQLSKSVMNDLERRLLRRWQDSWFETFLVAIILLNCVERMCWLYRTWDNGQWDSKWPLDCRPEHFYQQGERFSDMLLMLLKMRNIPPKTQTGPDDGLLHLVDRSHEAASRWFDLLHLTNNQLEERRSAHFDPMDSRSLELKFCSKLLLSTG